MAPARRTDYEISVERELMGGDPDRPVRARLSARIVPSEGAHAPTPEELREALNGLREELAAAAGEPAGPPRADRPLPELIETYRPRQVELVELLHEEGELSHGEHALLREYLAARGASPPPAPGPAAVREPTDRPLAAAPLAHEPASGTPRPVPELLQRYQISTLKQAGAVRARRQISFEEYMALKRHFDQAAASMPSPSPGAHGAPQ
jgi:hypothetical protein